MKKLLVVLALLFCSMNLFSQKLPDDWHTMADTAWVINPSTALAIAMGESPDMATAKKIALERAKTLGIELLGEVIADTLVSEDGGMKITKSRVYKQVSSAIRREATFQGQGSNVLYYLAVRVTVIK